MSKGIPIWGTEAELEFVFLRESFTVKKVFHLNGDSPRKVSETPEQSGFLLWRPRLPPVASCSLFSE